MPERTPMAWETIRKDAALRVRLNLPCTHSVLIGQCREVKAPSPVSRHGSAIL